MMLKRTFYFLLLVIAIANARTLGDNANQTVNIFNGVNLDVWESCLQRDACQEDCSQPTHLKIHREQSLHIMTKRFCTSPSVAPAALTFRTGCAASGAAEDARPGSMVGLSSDTGIWVKTEFVA